MVESKDSGEEITVPTESNSKCGPGTVFDSDANSCVLGNAIDSKDSGDETTSSAESNSKCGSGTVFDSDANSCVLD